MIGALLSLPSRLRPEVLRRVAARVVDVRGTAVFSVTFDDVLASAAGPGARILEDAGVRGTFYVSPGLAGSPEPGTAGDRRATLDEVGLLHDTGHQIGCHTHSHRRLAEWRSAEELAADCDRSRRILSNHLGGALIDHFSFPYGEYSLAAKRRLGRDYTTLRLTQGGLNHGRTDLTMLRAESIYSPSLDRERLAEEIDRCGRAGGWLVLYTHGVLPRPNEVGITPEDLAWVVERCSQRGDVLTVRGALARFA